MAAQFFDAGMKQDEVAAGLARADYAPLRNWLTNTIYRYGRSSTPAETLQRVTGGPLDIRPYVAVLAEKVAALTRQA
jgi:carboxypeptidase Taq